MSSATQGLDATTDGALVVSRWDGASAPWDDFVARDRDATFCHLAAWREVIAEQLGHECVFFVAQDSGGEWKGVLPLVRVRSPLGHYHVSMPFLNYGGPLGTPDAQGALADAAVAGARAARADLLELRARHPVSSSLSATHRKLTVVLELPDTVDALWEKTFDHKLRNKIRRAQRVEMTVRFGAAEIEPFYEVFARRMRELGTPVLPLGFFSRLSTALRDQALFGVVYWSGQPLAAGCGFLWQGEYEMTWSAQITAHRDKFPNLHLYWGFMQEVLRRGARKFNFGRSTPGSGTHEFKHQWGGQDVPLPWLQWSPSGVASPPSPDQPLYRAATFVWRHLPLGLTKLVGPRLARFLP
jgi:serine/alanine adding enzyme